MPARRAISSVDAPERPCSANTSRATSSTSSRRSSALFRVVAAGFTASKLSLTHNSVKRVAGRSGRSRDDPRELGPGVDVELAVRVRQVVFDRLRAEEEGRRDLLVRLALGDQ